MRVALYGRVSKDNGSQDTENQMAQLRAFAATQGWIITREYTDRASGKSGDRKHFKAMFEDASRRDFDVLLFWSLDRLSREGTVETRHVREAESSATLDSLRRALAELYRAVPGLNRYL